MDSVRERLDIPRFWWRGAERERPRTRARPEGRPLNPTPDLASLPQDVTPEAQPARSRRSWMPATACAALIAGAAAFVVVSRSGTLPASAPLSAHIDELMIMAGLGVDEIYVTGHRYTIDDDIFAALELGPRTSLLRYSPEAARRRVEALSWVKRATVSRVLPNSVEVKISERTPIAVWLHDNGASLVDGEGRELARVPASTLQGLPRISGVGAPDAVASLVAALGAHPALKARVVVSERVGQRRWSLVLDNGSRVHLPAEEESVAIERLMKLADSAGLLNEPGRIVDLRIEDRIAVAPRAATQTSSAAPSRPAIIAPRKSASAL
ncbi:cell division protein FtsQ/DivIB [Hyphomicrobium sp. CS1BSMeth3]|uniref:cell division protein FtsQ/DivIB n=1 Tax=Hyphomicrobium sp. CS1BSMeth3 TaxID=1892844 RepID=UPI0009314689|nr:cell division protein FtsQ/DivIB [Hyphomicrobium sp. CS1BSMeth3]